MLKRVHAESDTGHEDVGCHIKFEIEMETHTIMTPISVRCWRTSQWSQTTNTTNFTKQFTST